MASELDLSADIVDRLRSDQTLSPHVRALALDRAEMLIDNPAVLNSASWRVVAASGGARTTYERALRLAELATQTGTPTPGRLNTLALAQVRVGRNRDALETLARLASLRKNDPNDLVVAALAAQQR